MTSLVLLSALLGPAFSDPHAEWPLHRLMRPMRHDAQHVVSLAVVSESEVDADVVQSLVDALERYPDVERVVLLPWFKGAPSPVALADASAEYGVSYVVVLRPGLTHPKDQLDLLDELGTLVGRVKVGDPDIREEAPQATRAVSEGAPAAPRIAGALERFRKRAWQMRTVQSGLEPAVADTVSAVHADGSAVAFEELGNAAPSPVDRETLLTAGRMRPWRARTALAVPVTLGVGVCSTLVGSMAAVAAVAGVGCFVGVCWLGGSGVDLFSAGVLGALYGLAFFAAWPGLAVGVLMLLGTLVVSGVTAGAAVYVQRLEPALEPAMSAAVAAHNEAVALEEGVDISRLDPAYTPAVGR